MEDRAWGPVSCPGLELSWCRQVRLYLSENENLRRSSPVEDGEDEEALSVGRALGP